MPSESNKRIARNTLLLYFRMLFIMGVSFYTSRIILNTLGVNDFGIYNVVGGLIAMFGFLNNSMSSATQRFLTFEIGKEDPSRLRNVFCISVQIHLLIALVVFVLGETIGLWFLKTYMTIPADREVAAFWVYQLSILSTIIMFTGVPYNALIIAYEKMNVFAYISIAEVLLKLSVVLLLILTQRDKLIVYAILIFLVSILIRIIYWIYCSKTFKASRYTFVRDKQLFKEMSEFAGWNLFGNMAATAFNQGLNLLLNVFFNPAVNAARAIAVQVQSAVSAFTSNFQVAINPQITKTYATNDLKRMHKLIYTSSTYSFFLLFMLTLPVLFETEILLKIWLKIVPDHTVSFLRLILLITLVDTFSNPLIVAASATGKIKRYQTVLGSLLLLILPLSYLVLKFGARPEAVFVVNLSVVLIAQVVRMWLVKPLIQLSYKEYMKEVVIKVIKVVSISLIIPFILYYYSPSDIIGLIVVSMGCLLSVAFTVYSLGFGSIERKMIREKIALFKSRFRSN
jgi:O-antigen/teichoic acid export membrane protein